MQKTPSNEKGKTRPKVLMAYRLQKRFRAKAAGVPMRKNKHGIKLANTQKQQENVEPR